MTDFTLARPTRRLYENQPHHTGEITLYGMTLTMELWAYRDRPCRLVLTPQNMPHQRWDQDIHGEAELRIEDNRLLFGTWQFGADTWDIEITGVSLAPVHQDPESTLQHWTYFKGRILKRNVRLVA